AAASGSGAHPELTGGVMRQAMASGKAARGNALVLAVIFTIGFLATTGSLLSFGLARSRASHERAEYEQAVRACDAALAIKLAKFMRFDDHGLVGTFADGTRYAAIVREHPEGDEFRVTAAAV